MEGDAMEEGEMYDEAGEEVVIEDMDHAKLKNKVVKPKKRTARKTGPESSSEEEQMASSAPLEAVKTKEIGNR
jgi:hypothetical protein